jgi:hypothetical protein
MEGGGGVEDVNISDLIALWSTGRERKSTISDRWSTVFLSQGGSNGT